MKYTFIIAIIFLLMYSIKAERPDDPKECELECTDINKMCAVSF